MALQGTVWSLQWRVYDAADPDALTRLHHRLTQQHMLSVLASADADVAIAMQQPDALVLWLFIVNEKHEPPTGESLAGINGQSVALCTWRRLCTQAHNVIYLQSLRAAIGLAKQTSRLVMKRKTKAHWSRAVS